MSSLGKAVFKQTGLTSSQVITKISTALVPDLSKSLSLSQKKVWNPEEVVKLRNIFKEELQNNKVKLEVVHEKLARDKTFKLKMLLLINTVASTVSYLPCFSFFRMRNNLEN